MQSIFRSSGTTSDAEIKNFEDGYIDTDDPTTAPNGALTEGSQNVLIQKDGTIESRDGMTVYGNFLGGTTGILGGYDFVNAGGTQEQVVVWDTNVYRLLAGVWTALTGVTMTTNKQTDGAYFPLTNKFYIVNQTDNVVKYTSGSSADQSDSSFKKGKYIIHHQNRLLVANVSSQEDFVWYTDLGVDTFSANNYFRVEGNITGLVEYYDKVLIFTKRKIYRLQNFVFNGVAAGPEAVIELPQDFGSIQDRTIKLVNGFVYFVGQDITNKAAIYKCDGYKAVNVSEPKIANLMNGLSTAQLDTCCAVADGIYYHVEIAESGFTSNNLGIMYDTTRNRFLPPIRKVMSARADLGCMWSSETSGEWVVYGGSQSTGQVYRLHSGEYYDELPEERYLTLGTLNVPINANPAKRAAQSFKLTNYNLTQMIPISTLNLYMKKNAGTTTDLQVRIETDNAGAPSGTAVTNGTATLSAFTATSYAWKSVTFTTPPELSGNTTYWIVVKHITEGSGDSQYFWLGNPCTPTYAYGSLATYISGVWAADTMTDQAFQVFSQSAIEATAKTKFFMPSGLGKEFKLHAFMSQFGTVGNYGVLVGFDSGGFNSATNFVVSLASDTAQNTWGGGGVWGAGLIWGGQLSRNFLWRNVYGFVGRLLRVVVSNKAANQPWKFDGVKVVVTRRTRQA